MSGAVCGQGHGLIVDHQDTFDAVTMALELGAALVPSSIPNHQTRQAAGHGPPQKNPKSPDDEPASVLLERIRKEREEKGKKRS
jgi:hypothetical protein